MQGYNITSRRDLFRQVQDLMGADGSPQIAHVVVDELWHQGNMPECGASADKWRAYFEPRDLWAIYEKAMRQPQRVREAFEFVRVNR